MTEYSPDVKFCSELVDWRTSPPPQKKTRLCASYSNEGLLDRSLNNLKGESIRTWCVMSCHSSHMKKYFAWKDQTRVYLYDKMNPQ